MGSSTSFKTFSGKRLQRATRGPVALGDTYLLQNLHVPTGANRLILQIYGIVLAFKGLP